MSSFRADNRSWQYTVYLHIRLSESEHRIDIVCDTERLTELHAEPLTAQNIAQCAAYPRR